MSNFGDNLKKQVKEAVRKQLEARLDGVRKRGRELARQGGYPEPKITLEPKGDDYTIRIEADSAILQQLQEEASKCFRS